MSSLNFLRPFEGTSYIQEIVIENALLQYKFQTLTSISIKDLFQLVGNSNVWVKRYEILVFLDLITVNKYYLFLFGKIKQLVDFKRAVFNSSHLRTKVWVKNRYTFKNWPLVKNCGFFSNDQFLNVYLFFTQTLRLYQPNKSLCIITLPTKKLWSKVAYWKSTCSVIVSWSSYEIGLTFDPLLSWWIAKYKQSTADWHRAHIYSIQVI